MSLLLKTFPRAGDLGGCLPTGFLLSREGPQRERDGHWPRGGSARGFFAAPGIPGLRHDGGACLGRQEPRPFDPAFDLQKDLSGLQEAARFRTIPHDLLPRIQTRGSEEVQAGRAETSPRIRP